MIEVKLTDEFKIVVKNMADKAAEEYYKQNGIVNIQASWYEEGKAAISKELERKMLIAIDNTIFDFFEDFNIG